MRATPREAEAASRLAGCRVLLVEDEVIIALDLRAEIEDQGAEVVHARNLARALQLAEAQDFDVALLDVTLAVGQTSLPVARVLMRRGVPFVFHSGGDAQALADFAGAPVVEKPARAAEVLAALGGCLGRSAAAGARG